jgi:hypothetical protein
MATDLVKSNIYEFLQGFLTRPATAIPKGAQWVVSFDDLNSILPSIKKAYDYEPSNIGKWSTAQAAGTILNDSYQKNRGCMFCQAIALPGESMTANVEGSIVSNAFIRSYVGGGRNAFPIMRMTFIDTNISFADSFLRGWALATANFGMIARNDIVYRTNLNCYKFAITPKGPFIIQTMKFKDICCISVSEEEYTYSPGTSPVLREAQFVYNNYMIDTEQGNSSEILLNKRVEVATAVNPPILQYQPEYRPQVSLEQPISLSPEAVAAAEIARTAPRFLQ